MKTLEKFQAQELNMSEMMSVKGGFSILRIEGWFDGEKGSRCTLLSTWVLWDTY